METLYLHPSSVYCGSFEWEQLCEKRHIFLTRLVLAVCYSIGNFAKPSFPEFCKFWQISIYQIEMQNLSTVIHNNLPETPDQEQFDSTQEDTEEDEGDATSILDAEFDASTGEETDASGHLHHSASADRCC